MNNTQNINPNMRGVRQNPILLMKKIIPIWLTRNAIIVYMVALLTISAMYSSYSLPWYYLLSGVVAILVFFLYGSSFVQNTNEIKIRKQQVFEKRLFLLAIVPRVVFMLLLYWVFRSSYGDSFGFENQDATYYHELGQFVAGLIENGNYNFYDEIVAFGENEDIADMGYGVYVGFVYWLTDNSVIAVRVLKCLFSAWTVLLLYRIAKHNFGEQTARIAAIFCALWPNFWFYCAVHLKEVEMVFLVVLFVEQADQMLRSRQFTAWKVIPVLLIAALIFTFRTVLGLVALLALIFSVVMSSSRVVSWGKRIIVGVLAILLIGITVGNRLEERAQSMIEEVQSKGQTENMKWRSERKDGGNTFAKYAGAAVFAPMIFTLPFPTMVRPFEGQEPQQLLNGSNFIKNILSFFTIIAMIMLLMTGKWREHLIPLSYMLGYLVVLTLSNFAHSERFHQPAMPFEFMFAAYGLSIALTKPKFKRWYTYWCVFMLIVVIGWNWFKLKGRGMI